MTRRIAMTLFCLAALPLAGATAQAQIQIYAQDLSGFNFAAGNPPISLDFDSIAPDTDITGAHFAGMTLLGPGAPLIVVRGADTFTPGGFNGVIDPATNKLAPTSGQNVLSPGGRVLGPGPNSAVEDDDLTIVFDAPVASFGFDHLSQSADGFSFTGIEVFDDNNNSLYSGAVPISNVGGIGGGAPGGADFWGVVSQSSNIKRIVINEQDGDGQYPDCNIGFDTFRYVVPASGATPAPGSLFIALTGAVPGVLLLRRRKPSQ